MKQNLILTIQSYQEDITYLTLNICGDLSNNELKNLALDCKKIVDGFTNPINGSPNMMRFENKDGIYNYEMKTLVSY
jgi:hypothetical protein